MNNDQSLTYRLAKFASETRYGGLPTPVVHECKRLLLDTLGCALGAVNTASARIAIEYAQQLGGKPVATAIGLSEPTSATAAAYVNARLGNVLDADDTFPTSTHFGNPAIFAALALAEQLGRNGRDLLTAIAVGFDVGARIGSWMGPPMQIENGEVIGWNALGGPAASMIWAAIGTAVNIAGLDVEQTCHAFGIGGSNCTMPSIRMWAAAAEQPMYKYADAGWCAEIGVSAAMLARMGSTGYLRILDGEYGFWRMYGSPKHDDTALLRELGETWQILNTTYKPWPCCRWIHHPLTAFGRLRREHGLVAGEIERVVVRANPFALTRIFRDKQPTDPLTAEFSHAHAIAAAAHDIPAGPRWYDEDTLHAEHIRAFRDKVDVEPEPTSANIGVWMTGGQWRGIPGGVDIHARGKVFSATADNSAGDPWSTQTLFSDRDLLSKFWVMLGLDAKDGSGPASVSDPAAEVVQAVSRIESVGLADITRPLRALAVALTAEQARRLNAA